MSDPVFLDVDDVLLIHEDQLAVYGGSAGVRDAGLLESAVAMPRATAGGELAHEDLFAMAAAYAFHVAQNQPFLDGNKRTALATCLVFLSENELLPDEKLNVAAWEALTLDVAASRLGREQTTARLRKLLRAMK